MELNILIQNQIKTNEIWKTIKTLQRLEQRKPAVYTFYHKHYKPDV